MQFDERSQVIYEKMFFNMPNALHSTFRHNTGRIKHRMADDRERFVRGECEYCGVPSRR